MSLARLSPVARQLASASSRRTFSISTIRKAEGSAGSPRSGGVASGDAFTKREQANEDYFVKSQEREKLEAMKKRIADNEAQLAKDRKDVEEMQKKKSGTPVSVVLLLCVSSVFGQPQVSILDDLPLRKVQAFFQTGKAKHNLPSRHLSWSDTDTRFNA
nr:atpase inhibitor, mitochondrial [Quercus suber]